MSLLDSSHRTIKEETPLIDTVLSVDQKNKNIGITEQAFRMIFNAMRESFGEQWYFGVPKQQWNIWRHQIKVQLFDADIIAPEAIEVIKEATNKRQWPSGTGYFSRVRDLCLLRKKQSATRSSVKIDTGPESLADLTAKRYPQVVP